MLPFPAISDWFDQKQRSLETDLKYEGLEDTVRHSYLEVFKVSSERPVMGSISTSCRTEVCSITMLTRTGRPETTS